MKGVLLSCAFKRIMGPHVPSKFTKKKRENERMLLATDIIL